MSKDFRGANIGLTPVVLVNISAVVAVVQYYRPTVYRLPYNTRLFRAGLLYLDCSVRARFMTIDNRSVKGI